MIPRLLLRIFSFKINMLKQHINALLVIKYQ